MILRILLTMTAMFSAAEAFDFEWAERILLPILTDARNGAGGTVWESQLLVYNDSDEAVPFQPSLVAPAVIHPGIVTRLPIYKPRAEYPPGVFLFVRKGNADRLRFHLRIRESSQGQTAGTELPVVREYEFLTGRAAFLDIPVSPEYRSTLRIYGLENEESKPVLVRIFTLHGSDPFAEVTLALAPTPEGLLRPAYGEIVDLTTAFAVSGTAPLRIEVEPLDPEVRFWGFVSVTHNQNQHVMTITPQ